MEKLQGECLQVWLLDMVIQCVCPILILSCDTVVLFFLQQAPVQIKEFGSVTNIDVSPVAPHNFAVTAFTRV